MRSILAFAFALALALASSTALADDPEPREPEMKPTTRVRVDAGAFASTMLGLDWYGPFFSGAIIRQRSPTGAMSFGASGNFGEMPGGLSTGDVKATVGWEILFGRFRLGIGVGPALWWMSRTKSDKAGPITAAGVAGRGLVSFDVVRFDDTRAFYLAVVPEMETLRGTRSFLLHGDIGFLFRAAACAGARF